MTLTQALSIIKIYGQKIPPQYMEAKQFMTFKLTSNNWQQDDLEITLTLI